MALPLVSFILATHNRRDVLANTLTRIADCGLDRAGFEIIVVDNASNDGTLDVARAGADTVLNLKANHGSCAKAFGVNIARGPYIVFLDDDSFPRPGSVERMIHHFETQPKLGTAGFVVFLPDGHREGGALPDVFVGCGAGFRATALRQIGGLDVSFFMQAEEYDVAFRFVRSGWDVRVFGDIAVDHLKTPHARRSERTAYYDTCNNLRVINRYLPSHACRICREDCLQRYRWLAESDNHTDAFARGARDGQRGAWFDRLRYTRRRLDSISFESLFRWKEIAAQMQSLKNLGTRRILLAGLGKNIYPFVDAACRTDIEMAAIADDRFASPGRNYRGIPIIPIPAALEKGDFDRIIISNTAPVQATCTYLRLSKLTDYPLDHWFPETIDHNLWSIDSTAAHQMSDEILDERAKIRAACARDRTHEQSNSESQLEAHSPVRESLLAQKGAF